MKLSNKTRTQILIRFLDMALPDYKEYIDNDKVLDNDTKRIRLETCNRIRELIIMMKKGFK